MPVTAQSRGENDTSNVSSESKRLIIQPDGRLVLGEFGRRKTTVRSPH